MKAIMREEQEMKDSGIGWIGKIPYCWLTARLKDVSEIQTGSTPDKKFQAEYYSQDGGIPWIKAENLGTPYPILETKEYLTSNGCSVGRVFPANTVYVCCIASIGKVGYSTIQCSCNQQINGILFDNKYINYKYGYYLSISQEEEYVLRASGNVLKILNTQQQSYISCVIPTLNEQQLIANYLDDRCSKIDAIIAEAKASIEEYKELKQAVIYEALTKGLNKNVPMKNSGIKWIGKTPINWEVTQLKRYIDILPGYAFSSDDFAKDGIPLLRGINVTPNGTRWDDVVYWNQSIDDNLLPYMLKAGDIVVGLDRPWISDGTRAIIVKEADLPCLLLQRVCRIRVSSNVDYRFVYYWLIGKSFENALTSDTTGISVPHISTNQIGNFIISFPSLSEQILICDYVDKKVRGISSLISEKQSLIEDLEAYKKSLIYEVVTGKRKVVA